MHEGSFVFARLTSYLDRNKPLCRCILCGESQEEPPVHGSQMEEKNAQNVMSDSIIEFTTYKSYNDYPAQLRRVEYYDEEQDRHFVFLTNAMDITALEVALLYKNRWSVELFFKWVKQHLKIKKFWGDSENAVRIQIYTAISSYCLVVIVHHRMKLTI